MPLLSLPCPKCSSERVRRKQRSQARYAAGFDNGNYNADAYYYQGICYECSTSFYYMIIRCLDDPEHPGLIYYATEEEYWNASPYKLQPEKRHTTASEYSLRAASGADRGYLNKLEQLKEKPSINPNIIGIRGHRKKRKP